MRSSPAAHASVRSSSTMSLSTKIAASTGSGVPYELRTGAKAGEDQLLAIQKGGKRVEIAAEQFSPMFQKAALTTCSAT